MPYAIDKRVLAPNPLKFRAVDQGIIDRGEIRDFERIIWNPLPEMETQTIDATTLEPRPMTTEEKAGTVKAERIDGLSLEGLGAGGFSTLLDGRRLEDQMIEILGATCVRLSDRWTALPQAAKDRVTQRINAGADFIIRYYQLTQEIRGMTQAAGETEEAYLSRIRGKPWS